jgi:hypothetical protein
LRQEKLAEPPSRVIESRSSTLKIIAARQSYEAVAEVFALKEKKDKKDYDDRRRGKGHRERLQHRDQRLRGTWDRLMDFHGDRRFAGWCSRERLASGSTIFPILQLAVEVFQHVRSVEQSSVTHSIAKVVHFIAEG